MRLCAANAHGDVPYAAYNGEKAVFADNVQSYSTVEPAIDLTALTPAGRLPGRSTQPGPAGGSRVSVPRTPRTFPV